MRLRQLLMGTAVGHAEGQANAERHVDKHLRALCALLPCLYGESDACKQACFELRQALAEQSLMCKRALYLFGMAKERELCAWWDDKDPESAALAADLRDRVLPFLTPVFLKHGCQRPDAFLQSALVLATMWPGEQLGNYPL